MSLIIVKPAGVNFKKEKVNGEILFATPVSLSYVYAKKGKLYFKKYKSFTDSIWKKLSKLKPYNTLIYISEDDNILNFKKSSWCPLFLNKKTAIMAAGELSSSCRFDGAYLKSFVKHRLNPIVKNIPNLLFVDAGKWMIERFISFEAAMVAINSKGEISIFNKFYGNTIDRIWVFDSFIHSIRYQRQASWLFD